MNSHKCEYCSTIVEHSKKECYKCGAPNTKYCISFSYHHAYDTLGDGYRKTTKVTDYTGPR